MSIKNMSLKKQIISLVLIALVSLGAIIAYSAISLSKETLMKDSYHELTAFREVKKTQIIRFMDKIVTDIKVLSTNHDLHVLINDLKHVHEELNVAGDAKYPVSHELTKQKTEPHEEFLQEFFKDYGYYDVFVMCAKHGHVMYTAAKESDYGENLKHGHLKDSGLAEAWRKALQTGKPAFVDMRPYAPSNNTPAMFIATPVVTHGDTTAILAVQISDKLINEIMTYRNSYGDAQEDYLVGPDNLMRSDSYLDPNGHSLIASFANPSTGSVDTAATRAALSGQSGTEIVIDYNGNPVLSSYTPIKIGDDITWALMSEIDEAEVLITPNTIRDYIIVEVIIITSIITLIALVIIQKGLLNPLEQFRNVIKKIGQEKNLTYQLSTDAPTEISDMAESFNHLLEKLQDVINTAKQSSTENASIAHQLSTSSLGVGNNVEKSVKIVENCTNNAQDVKGEIGISIGHSQESKEEILKANKTLMNARDTIVDLTNRVQHTASVEVELATKMVALSKEASEVKNILDVISSIAEQTNLLALNAAIEAARAGEHGRGFAVVSDEVRSLAENTQSSLTEINTTINNIIASIEAASSSMTNNSEEIQDLANVASDVDHQINETVTIVDEATQASDKTVQDFEKTGINIDSIVAQIQEINSISSTNARSVEEIASAAEHLNTMTETLNALLEEFRT